MTAEQSLIAELIPLAGDAIELLKQYDEPSAKKLLVRLDTMAASPTGVKAIVEYVYTQPDHTKN